MHIDEAIVEVEKVDYKKFHYELDLKDMQILAPDLVSIDNEKFPLTKSGKHSLCQLLEIPTGFSTQLHADDRILWDEMTQRFEERKNVRMRFSVGLANGASNIFAFNKASLPWISNETFLEMVRMYLNTNDKLKLKGIMLGDDGIYAQIDISDKTVDLEQIKSFKGGTDIFKLGMNLINSELLSFRSAIEYALERIFCTNRASVREKGFTVKMVHLGSGEALIQNFYQGINRLLSKNISIEKLVQEKLSDLRFSNASLKELETAYKIGESCVERIPERLGDFDTRVPLKVIAKAYNLELPIKDKSDNWKRTASTPVNLYDLYNEITYIASNSKELSDEEKFAMQVAIGNTFLGKTPDLKDVAPIMNWN